MKDIHLEVVKAPVQGQVDVDITVWRGSIGHRQRFSAAFDHDLDAFAFSDRLKEALRKDDALDENRIKKMVIRGKVALGVLRARFDGHSHSESGEATGCPVCEINAVQEVLDEIGGMGR